MALLKGRDAIRSPSWQSACLIWTLLVLKLKRWLIVMLLESLRRWSQTWSLSTGAININRNAMELRPNVFQQPKVRQSRETHKCGGVDGIILDGLTLFFWRANLHGTLQPEQSLMQLHLRNDQVHLLLLMKVYRDMICCTGHKSLCCAFFVARCVNQIMMSGAKKLISRRRWWIGDGCESINSSCV